MFLNPQKIVNDLDIIEPGINVGDFGSGSGYFTFPLAQKVGTEGSVYAVDILTERLELIERQAKLKNFSNIKTLRANLEILGGTTLSDNSLNLILLANILFQSSKQEDIIKEAYRVLASQGYLLIIDWVSQSASSLIPKGSNINKDSIIKMSENTGLKFMQEFSVDAYHFGIILRK